MSLTFVCGRAGSGKSRFCFDGIKAQLEAQADGPPLILLLPEQATFQAEKELASSVRSQGFVRASVVGFRRLAYRILAETGGACRPQVTDLGKRLIVSSLLTAYQDELTLFGGKIGRRGFAETVCGLIQEFKNYNIGPELLQTAADGRDDTVLARKLGDLSLIYQGFETYLAEHYLDGEDYPRLLREKLPESGLLRGATVWIDGFHWFTPAEYSVLEQILLLADKVYLTLCLPEPDAAFHNRETALFHRQYRTRLLLKGLAAKAGVAADDLLLQEAPRYAASPLLAHIEQAYAGVPARKPPAAEREALRIAEAANPRAEMEGIAREIIRLCRDQGYRWRDTAVLLRDPETYGPLLEEVFTDFDIPFFSDRKRSAVHHPLAELLRSVLEIFQENWSYEPIFRCLKTDLFPVAAPAVEKLENYVLEFGIRGSRWTQPQPWRFQKRLSLAEDAEEDGRGHGLKEIHEVRMRVVAPLLTLAETIKNDLTVVSLTEALYQFLTEIDAAGTLDKWAKQAEEDGDLTLAKEHRQVWNSVIGLLDQLAEACGEQSMTLEEYSQVLNDGLDGIRLSLIPPSLDHVGVFSLEQIRAGQARAVFVPGLIEGVFPMKARGEGVLTDAERRELTGWGLELAPGTREDVFAERFLVYTAFTRAGEYLWISYPLADSEGKALTPSPEIARLRHIAAVQRLQTLSFEPQAGDEREYIVHPRRSLSALAVHLRRYQNGETIAGDWWAVYNWALGKSEYRDYLQTVTAGLFHTLQEKRLPAGLARRLYLQGRPLRGSVTRFENYQACPFKHFVQYGLGLKERPIFRLAAPDLGQFLHAVLKEFGDAMQRESRTWGSLDTEECRRLCGEIVSRLAPKLQNEILLSTEQYKHMLGRLTKRVERAVLRLSEWDRVSRFKPAALELSFGNDGGVLPPLSYPLPGGELLEITGQIDRLDLADYQGKQYLLVVDYKSGYARLTLPEVYYGLKLQLLTYLLAAVRLWQTGLPGTDIEPAGILYYFVKNPLISGLCAKSEEEIAREINRQLKMPGWLLKEPHIMELIDGTAMGWSEFTKVGLGKGKEFYSACLQQLKSREEFDTLLAHVEQVFVATARQILAGEIAIRPYRLERRTPCGYCPYAAVCQFDTLVPGSEYRVLERLAETEILAKLAAGREEE